MFLEISPQETWECLQSGSHFCVDVRELDEWNEVHVEGVTHNPLSNLDLNAIPTDQPVIVICRSGNRSGKVAMQLCEDRNDIYNMVGGMNAWIEAGLPVVRPTQ